jgi:phosphoserine aminotransferase
MVYNNTKLFFGGNGMSRVYNFSAGPSMLPLPVLEKCAAQMLDYEGSGMSVMEMSHRSPVYDEIIKDAMASLRRIMKVPENYKILFLQGGASQVFASVPLNLMPAGGKADYIVSGQFSGKAYKEGQKYGAVREVASSKSDNFTYVPRVEKDQLDPEASFVHICYNNTIYGTKFDYIPDTGDVPLVADLSSCILSEPIDVSKFGLIYAGAQKNVAPAGLTIVIVREDLLGKARPETPTMLDYAVQAANDSMYNTPPTYPIYVAGLVFKWIEETYGGLEGMKAYNEKKCALLYNYLDGQDFYIAPVKKENRSMMNVTFKTGDPDLDAKFVKEAKAAGLVNLKGHRSVGGMRASIYNAMPIEGVEKLVEFMKKFARENA